MAANAWIIHQEGGVKSCGCLERFSCQRIRLGKSCVKGILGTTRFARLSWSENRGDPGGDRIRYSNPEIEPQGLSKNLLEIGPQRRASCDPANEFVQKKTIGSRVITVRIARFPERLLPGELSGNGLVIEHRNRGIAKRRLPCLMSKYVEKRRPGFSAAAIFGPYVSHLLIQWNAVCPRGMGQTGGSEPFCGRPDQDRRLCRPWNVLFAIAMAAGKID